MDTARVRLLLDAAGRMDPPDGTRSRRLFLRILSPAAMQRFRDEARRQARAMVAGLVEDGEFDAVPRLANAFPIKVLCDAVGLPEEGREHLLAFGDMAMNSSGPRDDRYLASIRRAVPAAAWVAAACKREALMPGGFGSQIYDAADAGEIPEPVAELMVSVFPTAGIDTTACTIANAIHALATTPDQWRLLHDDPDSFDLRRSPGGHVGFGRGVHACVGQTFARMEGEAVLGALAERLDAIELAGEPRRRDSNTLRSWASLPVRVTPRRGSSGSR